MPSTQATTRLPLITTGSEDSVCNHRAPFDHLPLSMGTRMARPITAKTSTSMKKKPISHPITVWSRGPIEANIARRKVSADKGAATNKITMPVSPPCMNALIMPATAASARKKPKPNKNPRFKALYALWWFGASNDGPLRRSRACGRGSWVSGFALKPL